jgi:hypothetical protein
MRPAERRQLSRDYRALHTELTALLFAHDPVGLNFGENADEYAPEVDTVLPRLRACHAPADVRRVLHEEFVRWFGAETAGGLDQYDAAAAAVWAAWDRFRAAHPEG